MFEGEIEKHTYLPLYWAAISGTIGAQSVLLAKCVMELIWATVDGENQFKFFGTYVLLAGMVATLLTQTHALNMATMHGDTMSTFPVFQAFWIGMSNISGIVFFQQAHNFNQTQWIMFPSALVLVMTGIYLISKHEKFGSSVKYSFELAMFVQSSCSSCLFVYSSIRGSPCLLCFRRDGDRISFPLHLAFSSSIERVDGFGMVRIQPEDMHEFMLCSAHTSEMGQSQSCVEDGFGVFRLDLFGLGKTLHSVFISTIAHECRAQIDMNRSKRTI